VTSQAMGAGASSTATRSSSSIFFLETKTTEDIREADPESFTSNEILRCHETWRLILVTSDKASPDPDYKSFCSYFHSLCFKSLRDIIQETRRVSGLAPLPNPHVLHTIIIFMLKLLSVYLSSFSAESSESQNTRFPRYSRALARSGSQLGIAVADYSCFERAFVCSMETAFDAQTALVWTRVWRDILRLLLPECGEQEALLGTKRPLRMSGRSAFRESHLSESESIECYAEYVSQLILSKGDEEENDPNSPHRRLYTSLHNSINFNDFDSIMMQPPSTSGS
jgi:hypothetical protein